MFFYMFLFLNPRTVTVHIFEFVSLLMRQCGSAVVSTVISQEEDLGSRSPGSTLLVSLGTLALPSLAIFLVP